MNRNEINNTANAYAEYAKRQTVVIRHAVHDAETVLSYFLKDEIPYKFDFSPNLYELELVVHIETPDYQRVLNAFKEHRPRIRVPRVETSEKSCTLYLEYNLDWSSDRFEWPMDIIHHEEINNLFKEVINS